MATPVDLETAKGAIKEELDSVIKVAAQQFRYNDRLSMDATQEICNVIEAIFIHGLRDAFFVKGTRLSSNPQPNFWPFVSKFTHRSIKTQINKLNQINSEIGKARAWVRIVLNVGELEHYVNLLSKDTQQLSNFYVAEAFLRNAERRMGFLSFLSTLSKITLNAPTNSSFLNSWTQSPLILAGLLSGTPQRVAHLQPVCLPKRLSSSSVGAVPGGSSFEEAVNALEFVGATDSGTASTPPDDDTSSVFSHKSLLAPIRGGFPMPTTNLRPTFSNIFASTPEAGPVSMVVAPASGSGEAAPVELPVSRRRTARVRRSSRPDVQFRIGSFISTPGNSTSPISSSLPVRNDGFDKFIRFKPTSTSGSRRQSERQTSESDSNHSESRNTVIRLEREKTELPPVSRLGNNFDRSAEITANMSGVSLHDEILQATSKAVDIPTATAEVDTSVDSVAAPSTSPSSGPLVSSSFTSTSSVGPPFSIEDAIGALQPEETDFSECTVIHAVVEEDQATLRRESEVRSETEDVQLPDIDQKLPETSPDTKIDTDTSVVIEEEKNGTVALLTNIQLEKGLPSQDFRCPSCRRSIGGPLAKFVMCSFDAQNYCLNCISKSDESIIPARVIHNWDTGKRIVSRSSRSFLFENADKPLLHVDKVNVDVYEHSEPLRVCLELRERLSLMVAYLLSCRQAVADELQRRIRPSDYLYTDVHVYSVNDLRAVISGALEKKLTSLIKFCLGHIESCDVCLQKGFVCEFCSSPTLVYPYQIDVATRCKACGTVYHTACFNEECRKCIRIAKYEARRRAAEKDEKDEY